MLGTVFYCINVVTDWLTWWYENMLWWVFTPEEVWWDVHWDSVEVSMWSFGVGHFKCVLGCQIWVWKDLKREIKSVCDLSGYQKKKKILSRCLQTQIVFLHLWLYGVDARTGYWLSFESKL